MPVERKVSPESDGSRIRIRLRESAVHGSIKFESVGGKKKLVSLALFAMVKVIPGCPQAEHTLDTWTVSDLEGGGQWLRILRNRRLDHVFPQPVT
ncbi:MAG: hypothetical protein ACLQIB_10080, partial [Isosphaeraceae bacterium]